MTTTYTRAALSVAAVLAGSIATAEPFKSVGQFDGRIGASGPDRGPIFAGSSAEISGQGFAPGQPVTLRQSGEDLNGGSPFSADAEGNLSATVEIPDDAEGGERVPAEERRAAMRGDKVEARFGGCEDFFPATITGSKPLGGGKYSYALAYDDGATETGVAASFIRRVGGAKTPATQRSAPKPPPAPELDGLVAYSKGGAPAPAEPRTSHAASLTAKPRPRSRDDDDDDDDAFDPVQSVDDWKKAAPKPRRPAVARPDIAARKAAQAEKNDAARRAEINRKKKEKACLRRPVRCLQ